MSMNRLEDCLSFLIGKAAQQVTRRAREALAPHGVTPVQYALLKLLWEREGQTGAELGARLVLDSATVTGVIDRLEAGGLVSRQSDPGGDRRVNRIALTADGRALQAPLDAAMDRVNAAFIEMLGTNRARDLWHALAQIGAPGD
jgi:MarR family transcriptional regulator, organic hydroperoxide resistance regulator